MFKTLTAIFLKLTVLFELAKAQRMLSCSSSATSAASDYYCLSVDSSGCSQCVAGVKYFCPTNPLLSTSSWKKGVKVLENCNTIPTRTAIATFNSANRYEGHAAVFVRCVNGNQIEVYDQWNGKKWGLRTLWNTAGTVSNNPNAFYVVMV